MNLTHKLIKDHLVSGSMVPGEEIGLRVDQTLTQDATGTLAYLQLEATGVQRVRTQLSVSYVDHNMLQGDFRNADDHVYLQDVAAKYGIHFSRAGNGICHQVHLERFSVPGATLVGTDSHTPTCGGMGMLALGAGGLDVATAMAGSPYYLRMPRVMGVELTGRLSPGVSAKDVIFEVLRRLSVKGGVGYILEYHGPGVITLDVPERATIANMGAELGATTSLFPTDARTLEYLRRQYRECDFSEHQPDPGADYDETMSVDLSSLEPLIACPDSPDNIRPVAEVAGLPVDQVAIGSCTNSSYSDLMDVANMLRGACVHPKVSLVITPGSRQVLETIASNGALTDLIRAGARILESSCGPCAGMGQVPASGAVSIRSFNRNFPGRSGGLDNKVYLASPLVCAAAAIAGEIADPRALEVPPAALPPDRFEVDDSGILPPAENPESVQVRRGPNIKPIPTRDALGDVVKGEVLIKLGDNISTDHILPTGSRTLPLRSNVPAISEFVFRHVDPDFVERARAKGGGVIVAAENYGQGSSREHAAICPAFLGVTVVIARSFARIHLDNLINFGVLPLTFADEDDYEAVGAGDSLEIGGLKALLREGRTRFPVVDHTLGLTFHTVLEASERQREILLAGGLLKHVERRQTDG